MPRPATLAAIRAAAVDPPAIGRLRALAATYGERFLIGLQGLKNLGEARDRKDVYRSGEKRTAEQ